VNNTSKSPSPSSRVDKSRAISVQKKDGETDDHAVSRMLVRGTVASASTVIDYSRPMYKDLSLTDLARVLREQGESVNQGDLSALERMLNGQVVALNAMFAELARRGALNMGEHLDATDRYIRLALKAQSQARATVETIAAIKNPPVVFARQANINNGGQQQVNNGAAPTHAANSPQARASARPGETASGPNELLEDCTNGRTQLDTRATAAASRANLGLEPVGALDRPANR